MRIGILTLPLHINYGGILQAYALQTVLERMGHEVYVFDKPLEQDTLPVWKMPLSFGKRFIRKYILRRKNAEIFVERNKYRRQKTSRHFTQRFIEQNIHRYVIHHPFDVKESDFDAIVVGSDQIWRMLYFKSMWEDRNAADAFLSFTDGWNIKRVAYAASFGLDNPDIPSDEIDACKRAISQFDAVSVREQSGKNAIERLFGIKAEWMLDPTLLLQADDYLHLLQTTRIQKKNMLMSYILDDNDTIDKLRQYIATDKQLDVRLTNVSTDRRRKALVSQPPLEDWIESFVEADYVLTDSFHACVFSIIFHKQFTVIANEGRGLARFQSLLGLFGLENRLIMRPEQYHSLPDIDYSEIEKLLCEKRGCCLAFLKSSLK